jgi:hypothetical protein
MTVQAANGRDTWVYCVYCLSHRSRPKGWHAPSGYARAALKQIQQLAGVQLVITEARVLNGRFGPFDFSLVLAGQPARRLEIEVDGETHSSKGMHGTTPQQQQEIDRKKDDEAWRQQRCLLRLHHRDTDLWPELLQQAVDLATHPDNVRFVKYSPSYKCIDRCEVLEVSKAGCGMGSQPLAAAQPLT